MRVQGRASLETIPIRALILALTAATAFAEPAARRIVVIKVDGLPGNYLSKALAERDPETGKPTAANIHHIFTERGTTLANFYCRGISLSAPGWMTLDTGQPSILHGNVEYDRYTLRVHDYLNFFPFMIAYSGGRQTDMPGVEVADDFGVKLLIDRFPYDSRLQSFQLLQRGASIATLQRTLTKRFTTRGPRQLFDEWQAGFSMSQGVYEQLERQLAQKLADPKIQYLDFFTGEFDHQAHLTRDPFTQRAAFLRVDELIGRVWRAVQASPMADRTVMAVVSDHGMNSSESVYSQGFNLVRFFNSPEGGSHHVLTNRHPMQEFKFKGMDPMVNKVVSRSETSPLDGKYPTVLLDLDGNERASIHFRNRHLQAIHLLLLRVREDRKLAGRIMEIIESQRERWGARLAAILGEVSALGRRVEVTPQEVQAKNSDFSPAERAKGLHLEARRSARQVRLWQANRVEYAAYAASLEKLLGLSATAIETGKFRIEELVPPGVMGEPNLPEDLRAYPVEWTAAGEFRTMDYLAALTGLRVRNVVQEGLGDAPVDIVAMRDGRADSPESVLLYGGVGLEVRIESRVDAGGGREIRYVPVGGTFRPGFPLRLFEDPNLVIPAGVDRGQWLSEWHSEQAWLEAAHRTRYSNGVIGVADQFSRLRGMRREAVQADLLVLGNDHWNFNVRNFNPGGNHGSFFRVSTHSVLMFWGGVNTGIARGRTITEPYDALSFAPTVLELLGMPHSDMPGRVVPLISGDGN